jgi:hypothetical protein
MPNRGLCHFRSVTRHKEKFPHIRFRSISGPEAVSRDCRLAHCWVPVSHDKPSTCFCLTSPIHLLFEIIYMSLFCTFCHSYGREGRDDD